jgi:hypothetical protein
MPLLQYQERDFKLDKDFGSKLIQGVLEEDPDATVIIYQEPQKEYFSTELESFSDHTLKMYIIFWDYMDSESMFVKGIYEWLRRGKKDFEIENISLFIQGLEQENYISNSRYNEYIQLLIDKKEIDINTLVK